MKIFIRMSYWFIRLLETIFYSSKSMPHPLSAIRLGTVCKLVMSTLEAGHPDPLIYTIKHLWDILGRGMSLVSLPSCHITLSSWNASLLNNGKAILRKMHSKLKECILKGSGSPNKILTYNTSVIIICSCLYLYFQQSGEMGWPTFLAWAYIDLTTIWISNYWYIRE